MADSDSVEPSVVGELLLLVDSLIIEEGLWLFSLLVGNAGSDIDSEEGEVSAGISSLVVLLSDDSFELVLLLAVLLQADRNCLKMALS